MLVSPSILTCDFSCLNKAVDAVSAASADYLHLDVMDGIFVPNLTFGAPVIRSLRALTNLPFDTHLMMQHPDRLIDDFIDAGSDIITIHMEADCDIADLLTHIRNRGKKAGLSIKPGTSVEAIYPYLSLLDQVLVMTVEPGFGGQAFRADMLPKIVELRREIDQQNLSVTIEVDGGVNRQNAATLAPAGVDAVVVGSAFFADQNPAELTAFLHSL